MIGDAAHLRRGTGARAAGRASPASGLLRAARDCRFSYHNDDAKTKSRAASRSHANWSRARRRRLRGRRRLPLPHRPRDVHDHLRRGEHLPAGDRGPAHHAPEGGRRRRSSACRTRRWARRSRPWCSRPTAWPARPTSWPAELLAYCALSTSPTTSARGASTSWTELPRLPTGKLYKRLHEGRLLGQGRLSDRLSLTPCTFAASGCC
jgi:hypothetical protein